MIHSVRVLLFILLLSSPLAAQEEDRLPRFSTRVEQVVVYVSVYDQNSALVSGLPQEDFALYEDGIEQELTSFAQSDVPSTIGLVIDTSGSMRSKMRDVEKAVGLFLDQSNPQNQLFFIRFDDEVELEEGFTYEVEDIRDALANVIVKGGTALFDAIYLGVDHAQDGDEPKKVVVVFTDGEDKDSYYTHDELLAQVREMDTQIFVIAFLDETLSNGKGFFGIFKSEREKVQEQISAVAEVTGGQAFFPDDVDQLSPVFEAIAHELKNQYRLAYISSNPRRDGSWREIEVKVREAREKGYRVRARKGYYTPTETTSSASESR